VEKGSDILTELGQSNSMGIGQVSIPIHHSSLANGEIAR
jgi:hypothetical protein